MRIKVKDVTSRFSVYLFLVIAAISLFSGCMKHQEQNLVDSLPPVSGVFFSDDKVMKLVIPNNSWPVMIAPELREVTAPVAFTTPTVKPVGKTYQIGPVTVTPTGTLSVTLTYTPTDILNAAVNESILRVYRYLNNTWVPIETNIDQINNVITFTTTNVGIFRIGGDTNLSTLAVTLNAPASDPNIGLNTRLSWFVADAAAAAASHTFKAGVFTADTDSALLPAVMTANLSSGNWTIASASTSPGFTVGTTYYWGVRYIAADGTNGPWVRRSFVYTPGPVVVNSFVPVCNLTSTGMTVFWRTEAASAVNRVYYAFDGAVPSSTGLMKNEDAALSSGTMHIVNLSWVGENHSTVAFFIHCENSAVPAVSTDLDNNGANYIIQVGQDATPPPAPEIIVAGLGSAANGDFALFRLRKADGSKTFFYLSQIAGGAVNVNHLGTRWNLGSSSPLITETLDTLKITDVSVHSATGATSYSGDTVINNVAGVFTAANNIDTVIP
ncbi:MAG: hypothetical protein CVV64_17620 [Candidatus Wallbacteria bacterium HGW-Wallbacteria-1]|uniref:ZU5 domain-containing protein n=1 Tax=Candidatus Wallbacteria bacterium HGW-Wallbacteria-1 TaxID=2013854 RepID=A0A2N1PK63_9BACT|nr:MAG: hypothetical protein CVV64_17620 [Candidatus Wallbacteria bacterium HGW-Wallbacteria-1]